MHKCKCKKESVRKQIHDNLTFSLLNMDLLGKQTKNNVVSNMRIFNRIRVAQFGHRYCDLINYCNLNFLMHNDTALINSHDKIKCTAQQNRWKP